MGLTRSQRLVALACSCVVAATGAVCLIVAVDRLDSMPAAHVCAAHGYAQSCVAPPQQQRGAGADADTLPLVWVSRSNCSAPNQTIFSNNLAPPCCQGAPNASNAWGGWDKEVLDDLETLLNHVSCDDIAQSLRAGLPQSRPLPDGEKYTDDTLDEFQDIAEASCFKSRLESGFYFLYLTGPLVLVAAVVSAVTLARDAAWGTSASTVLLAAGVAACAYAVDGLLRMRDTQFGYERRIMCADLPQRYVVQGVYLDTFVCTDVTVGGELEVSPVYAYLNATMALFIAGAVFSVMALLMLAAMLGLVPLKGGRRPRGAGREADEYSGHMGAPVGHSGTLLGAGAGGGGRGGYLYR